MSQFLPWCRGAEVCCSAMVKGWRVRLTDSGYELTLGDGLTEDDAMAIASAINTAKAHVVQENLRRTVTLESDDVRLRAEFAKEYAAVLENLFQCWRGSRKSGAPIEDDIEEARRRV